MNEKVIIALMGKAGTGKSYMMNSLHKQHEDWHPIVSYTTRPKRDYEEDGRDYHFISIEEFAEKVINGDMLEATSFNNWIYGTAYSSLKEGINIGVFNPEGFSYLSSDKKDLTVLGYLLECQPRTRLLRQVDREADINMEEISRRWKTDGEDFLGIENKKEIVVIKNENIQDMVDGVKLIEQQIQSLGTFD